MIPLLLDRDLASLPASLDWETLLFEKEFLGVLLINELPNWSLHF